MQSIIELADAVSARVQQRWQAWRATGAGVGAEIGPVFDVGADLLTGGKRLRAAFAAAGWRSCAGAPLEEVEVALGSGLELFQMAALVHDDLMDGSATRRGRPAAHRQFAAHHDEACLSGDRERFGAAGAILLGDLMLVASRSELEEALADLGRRRSAVTRAVIDEMMGEVTLGQFLDIHAQSAPWSEDPTVDLDRARRVIRAKSARYSVEHPLVLGAAAAGASAGTRRALRRVGLPIGEAFQLRDDLLGVFGDPATTGKPAGDDLREGKRTVLVTEAMAAADGADREFLRANIGRSDLGAEDVEALRELLLTSGAVTKVEALIEERYAAGIEAIERCDLTEDGRTFLRTVADAAVDRLS